MKDGIEDMQLSQVSFRQMPATLKVLLALAVSAVVVTSGGCGTTTETRSKSCAARFEFTDARAAEIGDPGAG